MRLIDEPACRRNLCGTADVTLHLLPEGVVAVHHSFFSIDVIRLISRRLSACRAKRKVLNYRDVLSASGMRRSTLLKLSSMELHEVAHVRRCFAGELAHGVRHAVVTPLPGQLDHG
jgi:hypothetical protein